MLTLFSFLVIASSWAAEPLFVDSVNQLTALEQSGYFFSQQLGESSNTASNEKLYQTNSGYKLVVDTITNDIQAMVSNNTGVGMKYSRRLFNPSLLKSKKSFYELAGVTVRRDRGYRHAGKCGEVRLIYRLAYQDDEIKTFSRLPMTAQIIRVLNPPCKTEDDIAKLLEKSEFLDLEVNIQSVRWPAAIRPDMGAYAEYVLRVFEKAALGWREKVLENTIDVAKLQNDPALKAELLNWLLKPETAQKVDLGEALLDSKFLTRKGTSIAVHGLNREANRLFSQVYSESEFNKLDFSAFTNVKSAKGFLRKLDEMTCVGCHQSRSIAGFHFLGKDRPNALQFNRVHIPFSNHFLSDLKRRTEVASERRARMGFVDQPTSPHALKNERCYVGNDKSFVSWKCGAGLKCEPIGATVGEDYFGICQEAETALAGDACYFGRVTKNVDAKKDKEISIRMKSCREDLGCLHPSDGYPGGLCFANFCDPNLDKTCGALAVPGFNPCLAKNRPFRECLEKFTAPIEAGGCSLDKLCRDDFICMEGYANKGVCAPPYSLFQLRVDGHTTR